MILSQRIRFPSKVVGLYLLVLLGVLWTGLGSAQTPNICVAAGGSRGQNLFANNGTFGTLTGSPSSPTWASPLGGSVTTYNYVSNTVNTAGHPLIGSPEDGDYTVSNTTAYRTDGAWFNTTDHGGTSSSAPSGNLNGLMMVVNASTNAGTFYQETLNTAPNTNYEYSIWAINIVPLTNTVARILPDINLAIDRVGVDDNNDGTIDEANESQIVTLTGDIQKTGTATWLNYGGIINSGASTQIRVRFINNAGGGDGNDLAIDDLNLTTCNGLATGGVSGTLFADVDSSGNFTSGDITFGANIGVNLIGKDNNNNDIVTSTAQTDTLGRYSFANIPAGTYKVQVQTNDPQLSGATPSSPSTAIRTNVVIPIGATTTSQDFGFGFVDLSIDKSHAGDFSRFSGIAGTGQYTIQVTNNGTVATNPAQIITVVDTLPTGFTYTGFTATSWSCVGTLGNTVVTCTRPTTAAAIPSGSSSTIIINVSIATSVPATPATATVPYNRNNVSLSGGGDIVTSNNSDFDDTRVDIASQTINLSVSKTLQGATNPVPGTQITYQILVTNLTVTGGTNYTGTISNISLLDVLPPGFQVNPGTLSTDGYGESRGVYNPATGVWQGVNLSTSTFCDAGYTTICRVARMLVTGTIDPSSVGSITNSVTVAPDPDGTARDSDLSNNTSVITGNLAPQVNLSISKTDNKTSAVAGSANTYTITVLNSGSSSLVGGVVTDTFNPSYLTGATWTCVGSAGSTCSSSGSGDLSDSVRILPGGSIAYTVLTTVNPNAPAGTLTNNAVVTVPTGVTNSGGSSASDSTTISRMADISIEKTAGNSSPSSGSQISFTITARNLGPSSATGLTVTDLLPAGLTFSSAAPSVGIYASSSGLWSIGTLMPGSTETLVITAIVSGSGSITNTASKTFANETDPQASNNQSSVTITVGVFVSGFVFADAQPNGIKDSSEVWNSAQPLYVNLVSGSSVVASALVSNSSGTYSLSGIGPGNYQLVLSSSATSISVGLPTGWVATEPSPSRLNLGVASTNIVQQNFGLFSGSKITGTLFRDDGRTGGTANNAIQESAEAGIANQTISLLGGPSTITSQTGTDGKFSLYIPSTFSSSLLLRHTLSPATGTNIAGGSVQLASSLNQSSARERSLGIISAGQVLSGYNFGVVFLSGFTPDQNGQGTSPGTVTYSHLYKPGTMGTVTLSVQSGGLVYPFKLDRNCDGDFLDAGEGLGSGSTFSFVVDATWPKESDGTFKACALEVLVIIPAGKASGTVDMGQFAASLVWASNPVVSDVKVVVDFTTLSTSNEMQLTKQVRNATTGGVFANSAQGRPGENLEYCIQYRNLGTQPVNSLVITDPIPFFTSYVPASINWNTVAMTDGSDADAAEFSSKIVRVNVGLVPAGVSGSVCYRALIL